MTPGEQVRANKDTGRRSDPPESMSPLIRRLTSDPRHPRHLRLDV